MQMGGLMGGVYRVCEWIMRVAYINILWVLFTFIGLILFGFMPAAIAMFTIIRKWIMGETEIPVLKTFWATFKQEFFKGNLFGLIILVVGSVLYIDLLYLTIVDGILNTVLLGLLFLAGILYIIFLLYIIPVYVHYDLKFSQYIKYSLMIGITNFKFTIFMIVGIVGIYFWLIRIPASLLFFGVSLTAFYIMWLADLSFKTIIDKKEKYEQKQQEKVTTVENTSL
ncbi:YesL family protein [Evansella sp. AB-P1]|uniref:YesL family protein n=1 Tax=Evansella sp. AB-P1 TaxID=3037653 RepID=UPI00241C2F93|nr:YesL family protein [Evansella sp. AB-P1]MDG5789899.1 YesL family protein [Evansella sp. AB-P1]